MLKEDLKYITTEHLRDTDQISVRAANCCKSVGLNTFYKILLYFEENGSFFNNKIRNAGRKTCEELDKLCLEIIPNIKKEKSVTLKEIAEVSEVIKSLTDQERELLLSLANLITDTEEIIKEKMHQFSKYCGDNLSFAVSFYNKNGHLPMFWILEQYLIKDKNRDIEILKKSFNIFKDSTKLSLEEIAVQFSITRERARQIRNEIFSQTFEITDNTDHSQRNNLIKYHQLLQNKEDWIYTLEFIKTNLNPESFEIQERLKKEQCNLSFEFALQIMAYLFRDTFSLFGGFKISNKDRIWRNTFLIRKEYVDIFDFDKVKEEFSHKLAENTTDYLLDIDNYITNSQCWKQFNFGKADEITNIVKDILLYEYGLYSEDIDGYQIKIPANKERCSLDVVYEILQTKGEPMYLGDIFAGFKKIMPEHKYTLENNADRLRPFLQRHNDITYRKRSSIYLLKEWGHIKSGTIRDAIIEFLSSKDLPQAADDITEYIIQYFPETNIASIRTSMFNDTRNRFSFFQNNYFGLTNKEYPPQYEQIERQAGQRQSFEQRLTALEKFIVAYKHFPFSSSKDKNEESLYRWWSRVLNGKQKIDVIQQEHVDRIVANYADLETDKASYEWNLNYNKFKLFLLENKRVPSAKDDEKFLYGWLRRVKDDFSNCRLSEEQRKKYIELAKLI